MDFSEVWHAVLQRILIVCVGNICRSPMAEVQLRRRAPHLAVSSAGLAALSGEPMDATAQAVLVAHGLDGSRHVARLLHEELAMQADLVLAMEHAHLEAIRAQVPEAADRVRLMDHWNQQAEIADPFRQPRAVFEQLYQRLDQAITAWLPRLADRAT